MTASSLVVASANAVSTSIGTTTATAISGASDTKFASFSVVFAYLVLVL